jgi:hypothetical protein
MLRFESAWRVAPGLLFWFCATVASAQTQAMRAPVTVSVPAQRCRPKAASSETRWTMAR